MVRAYLNANRNLLIAVFILILHQIYYFPFNVDDTFISLRYADQVASGNGLVFNVNDRVEGYTNFLWVMIAAFFIKLNLDPLLCLKLLGMFLSIASLVILKKLLDLFFRHLAGEKMAWSWASKPEAATESTVDKPGDSPDSRPCLAPAADRIETPLFYFALFTPLSYWSTAGLETPLFSCLTLLSFYLLLREVYEKRFLFSGLAFLFLSLTRPEGIFLAGLGYGAVLIHSLFVSGRFEKWYFHNVGLFGLLFVPYFIFRLAYFGYIFPNSYYAKVFSILNIQKNGLKYLFTFFKNYPLMLLPFFSLFLLPKGFFKFLLALGLLAFTFYIFVIGGDSMPWFRFFLPIAGLLFLLMTPLLLLLKRYLFHRQWRALYFGVEFLMLLLFFGPTLFSNQRFTMIMGDRIAAIGKMAGLYLKKNFTPNIRVALNAVGAIPYYSKLHSIDMLGVNDKHIAHKKIKVGTGIPGHEKGDGEYVLALSPDLIIFSNTAGSVAPHYLSDTEINQQETFQKQYRLVKINFAISDYKIEQAVQYRIFGTPHNLKQATPIQEYGILYQPGSSILGRIILTAFTLHIYVKKTINMPEMLRVYQNEYGGD